MSTGLFTSECLIPTFDTELTRCCGIGEAALKLTLCEVWLYATLDKAGRAFAVRSGLTEAAASVCKRVCS